MSARGSCAWLFSVALLAAACEGTIGAPSATGDGGAATGDAPEAPVGEGFRPLTVTAAEGEPTRTERMVTMTRVALPGEARAAAGWSAPDGTALVVARDGRVFFVDARAQATELPRATDAAGANDAPAVGLFEPAPGAVLALVPSGALALREAGVARAALPSAVRAPTSVAAFGSSELWSSPDGLFTQDAGRWWRLDYTDGPARDVRRVAAATSENGARAAWVHAGERLARVEFYPGAAPRTEWPVALPPGTLGVVRALASMSAERVAVSAERGLFVLEARRALALPAPEAGAPDALAGGGGWLWAAWGGALYRGDGARWERLRGGVAPGALAQLAVDRAAGASALLVDRDGGATLVHVEPPGITLDGLANGATLTDTHVALTALFASNVAPSDAPREVRYTLDGRAFAARTAAPWGWGPEGARWAELGRLAFGSHEVTVTARFADREASRSLRFEYSLGSLPAVPSFATDVAPLAAAYCGRCHASGVAQNINDYERFRAMAPLVRSVMREARMPPDLLLEPQRARVFIAWIDGATPP